jgi:hypothetical protein
LLLANFENSKIKQLLSEELKQRMFAALSTLRKPEVNHTN